LVKGWPRILEEGRATVLAGDCIKTEVHARLE
jgi:hypothetical protein